MKTSDVVVPVTVKSGFWHSCVEGFINLFKSKPVRYTLSFVFGLAFVAGLALVIYYQSIQTLTSPYYILGVTLLVSGLLLLIYQIMLNQIPAERIMEEQVIGLLATLKQRFGSNMNVLEANLKTFIEKNEELKQNLDKFSRNNTDLKQSIQSLTSETSRMKEQRKKLVASFQQQLKLLSSLVAASSTTNLSTQQILEQIKTTGGELAKVKAELESVHKQFDNTLERLQKVTEDQEFIKTIEEIDAEQDHYKEDRIIGLRVLTSFFKASPASTFEISDGQETQTLTSQQFKALLVGAESANQVDQALEKSLERETKDTGSSKHVLEIEGSNKVPQ